MAATSHGFWYHSSISCVSSKRQHLPILPFQPHSPESRLSVFTLHSKPPQHRYRTILPRATVPPANISPVANVVFVKHGAVSNRPDVLPLGQSALPVMRRCHSQPASRSLWRPDKMGVTEPSHLCRYRRASIYYTWHCPKHGQDSGRRWL